MRPDDAAELVKLEDELAKPRRNSQALGFRIPWLVRLVRELDARVAELEAGDIDEVIDAKNAEIAKRDAHAAELSARLAKLEGDKLPSPDEYYRRTTPKENDSGNESRKDTVASGKSHDQTDVK